ncbi:hypothetical protein HNR23_005116 [Nocardiopsis mwathae]|uniref:Uncharacterized protein n=1 Tax=Nocardiopsis mwathae TaxID=1472723 RepID=A0A7X0D8S1_9ACTN|nr:hypothetical protein [Nocardiopsis mwathae]
MASAHHRPTPLVNTITSGSAAMPSAHPTRTPAHSMGMKGNGW